MALHYKIIFNTNWDIYMAFNTTINYGCIRGMRISMDSDGDDVYYDDGDDAVAFTVIVVVDIDFTLSHTLSLYSLYVHKHTHNIYE